MKFLIFFFFLVFALKPYENITRGNYLVASRLSNGHAAACVDYITVIAVLCISQAQQTLSNSILGRTSIIERGEAKFPEKQNGPEGGTMYVLRGENAPGKSLLLEVFSYFWLLLINIFYGYIDFQ